MPHVARRDAGGRIVGDARWPGAGGWRGSAGGAGADPCVARQTAAVAARAGGRGAGPIRVGPSRSWPRAAGVRTGIPMAARALPSEWRAVPGARRLPQRQPDGRRARPGGCARLGAGAPGRPDGRPRLDLRQLVALRPRTICRWAVSARAKIFSPGMSRPAAGHAERVHYWEVLGTLKWGIICESMAHAWLSGAERDVEKAAIGRRASESEIDLLALLAPR